MQPILMLSKEKWDDRNCKKHNLDNVAKAAIFKTLDPITFSKIKHLKTAMEIWQGLGKLCEGSEHLRKQKIEVLLEKFKSFKMLPGESFDMLDERFHKILNDLASLNHVLSPKEKNVRLLRSLPTEWYTKATAMEEGRNLENYTVQGLLDDLRTYEHELMKKKEEQVTPFPTALMTTPRVPPSEGTCPRNCDTPCSSQPSSSRMENYDEEFAMMVKQFRKFKKFFKKADSVRRPSKGKPQVSDSPPESYLCYNCRKPGHWKSACPYPKVEKYGERERNEKKKKAMVAAESDESSSSSSDEEALVCMERRAEKSNHEDRWTMSEDDTLCLMAKDDAEQEVTSQTSCASSYESIPTSESLFDKFKKMMKDFEEINLKHSSLTEENKLDEITQLKTENKSLSEKVKSLNKELGILKSKEAVDKLLETAKQKGRDGLGFDPSSSKRKGRTTFIPPKPTAKSYKQKGKEKEKLTEVPKKEAAKYPGVWYLDSGCSRHMTESDEKKKKAMVAAESDESSSSSSDEEALVCMERRVEKSNHEDRWTMSEDDTLCLMAKDDADQEVTSQTSCSSSYESIPTSENLFDQFKKMMVDFEEINLKHSSLTEENKLLSEENLKLTEGRKSQLDEITQLKTENESLSEKVKSLNKELGTLKSKEAEDKLLETTKHKGREGLGISQFCDKGYSLEFCKDMASLKNISTNEVILTGKRIRNIYEVMWDNVKEACLISKGDTNLLWLWHKRMGHLNFKTLNKLSKEGLVEGLPKAVSRKESICDAFQKEKQVKSTFKAKPAPSTTRILSLVHMDLFGPITPISLSGKKYVLVVVDDYSRYTWTIFLNSKKETQGKLTNYIRLIQNQANKDEEINEGDRMKPTEFIPFGSLPLKTSQRNPDSDSAEPTGNHGQPSNIPDQSNDDNSGNGDPVPIHPESPTNSVLQPETELDQPVIPNQHNLRWLRDHPPQQVIGDIQSGVRTRSAQQNLEAMLAYLLTQISEKMKILGANVHFQKLEAKCSSPTFYQSYLEMIAAQELSKFLHMEIRFKYENEVLEFYKNGKVKTVKSKKDPQRTIQIIKSTVLEEKLHLPNSGVEIGRLPANNLDWNIIGISRQVPSGPAKKADLNNDYKLVLELVIACLKCGSGGHADDITQERAFIINALITKSKVNWAAHFFNSISKHLGKPNQKYLCQGLYIGHILESMGAAFEGKKYEPRYWLYYLSSKGENRVGASTTTEDEASSDNVPIINLKKTAKRKHVVSPSQSVEAPQNLALVNLEEEEEVTAQGELQRKNKKKITSPSTSGNVNPDELKEKELVEDNPAHNQSPQQQEEEVHQVHSLPTPSPQSQTDDADNQFWQLYYDWRAWKVGNSAEYLLGWDQQLKNEKIIKKCLGLLVNHSSIQENAAPTPQEQNQEASEEELQQHLQSQVLEILTTPCEISNQPELEIPEKSGEILEQSTPPETNEVQEEQAVEIQRNSTEAEKEVQMAELEAPETPVAVFEEQNEGEERDSLSRDISNFILDEAEEESERTLKIADKEAEQEDAESLPMQLFQRTPFSHQVTNFHFHSSYIPTLPDEVPEIWTNKVQGLIESALASQHASFRQEIEQMEARYNKLIEKSEEKHSSDLKEISKSVHKTLEIISLLSNSVRDTMETYASDNYLQLKEVNKIREQIANVTVSLQKQMSLLQMDIKAALTVSSANQVVTKDYLKVIIDNQKEAHRLFSHFSTSSDNRKMEVILQQHSPSLIPKLPIAVKEGEVSYIPSHPNMTELILEAQRNNPENSAQHLVLESRLEGNTSIFVPVDRGGSKCFFNAVDVFIGKTKNPYIQKTLPATQLFTMVHEAHAPSSSNRHGSSGGMTLGGPPTDGFVANKTSDGTHPPKVPLPEFSPIDKAPAVILGGGNEISTDSQPTLEIGKVDDGTEALQPGVSGARNQLQPGTPGELEPKDESIKPCLLNREEQLIIDGLFKHAPEMQVSSLDIPIQSELKLMMIDANVEESARGDLQKEFEILKPIFEQHISDDFEQSLWIIKEALRSPFVIEKIQKGLVKTLQADYITQKTALPASVIVGVFTSNLVKEYMKRTTLSTTTATKVFLDVAIDEVAALKNKYSEEKTLKPLLVERAVVDRDTVLAGLKTIAEILAIASTDLKNGIVKPSGSKFWCKKDSKLVDDAVPRYRLEAIVKDETEVTKFIIFDDEAEKLIGQSAISLYDMEEKLEDEETQGQLPALITNLIGQRFVFHVKLTEYNKTAYTHSFGANKVHKESIIGPMKNKETPHEASASATPSSPAIENTPNKKMCLSSHQSGPNLTKYLHGRTSPKTNTAITANLTPTRYRRGINIYGFVKSNRAMPALSCHNVERRME
ncbi:unnamed protein product [Cuscuta campestris]|uniref:CCHC-type domain-containing protein n=1 Tax=Cuscuta campestris TaxID=132261 RepID=A0A484MEC0_9ASTE|nr:unnamed protein product [Cuscuta campestris]